MRIVAAQFNPMAGDPVGNGARIVALARDAALAGAQLLVTPQGALAGYPCGDLLWREAFVDAVDEALQTLQAATKDLDLHLLVGHPVRADAAHRSDAGDRRDARGPAALHDAASLLHRGRIVGRYHRQVFSRHDPFAGLRYFQAGAQAATFTIEGVAFGVLIGEDGHEPALVRQWCDRGAQVLLALDAEPIGIDWPCLLNDAGIRQRSPAVAGAGAFASGLYRDEAVSGLPAARLVVNPVGAQDEFVFEGCSHARNADGAVVAQAPAFEDALLAIDVRPSAGRAVGTIIVEAVPESAPATGLKVDAADAGVEARVYAALVTGVRDFVRKNGFPGALLGLSGGIDSALVLAIAVDALGPQQVHAVMMPSPYTSDMSREDAGAMAALLGVPYEEIPISGCFDAFRQTLAAQVPEAAGITVENLQARIRGTLLMALSNRSGKLVLTAGNKSESAVGYSTLYGDMAGGLAVIKDVCKTMVWRLARWRNRNGVVIPPRIIERPPSAELAPGQLDQDSLPPYETLDAILARHLEGGQGVDEIVAAGFVPDTVRRVVDLVRRAEFKRHQAAPGIRVTRRPFDSEWRRFVTCGFSG